MSSYNLLPRKTSQIVPLSLQKQIGNLVQKRGFSESGEENVTLSIVIRGRVIRLEALEALADCLVAAAISLQIIVMPMIYASQLSSDTAWLESVMPLTIFSFTVFILDQVRSSVVPVRTLEVDKDMDASVLVKIVDTKTVARNYILSSRFVCDILSELNGVLLISGSGSRNVRNVANALSLLCVVRFGALDERRKLRKEIRQEERKTAKDRTWKNMQRILVSIATFALLAHYLGCGFFVVGMVHKINDEKLGTNNSALPDNWIDNSKIGNETFSEQYVDSMYWAVTTLVTVGYGDVVPVAYFEKIYSIFVLFIGASAYAAVFGSVTTLFQNLDISRNRYNEKMDQTSEFLKHAQLPEDLERKVVAYTNKLWSINKGFEFQNFLQEFPLHLQTEITMTRLAGLVRKVPMFGDVSENFLKELVMCLKPSVCLRNDYIFKKGDIAQAMYFLLKGQLCIVLETRQIVAILSPGSCFGEIGVVAKASRTASVMADVDCEYYTLHHQDIENILEMFPEYRAKVTEMAERRLMRDVQREEEEGTKTNMLPMKGNPISDATRVKSGGRSSASSEILQSMKQTSRMSKGSLSSSFSAGAKKGSDAVASISRSLSKKRLTLSANPVPTSPLVGARATSKSFRRRTSMDVLEDLVKQSNSEQTSSHGNYSENPYKVEAGIDSDASEDSPSKRNRCILPEINGAEPVINSGSLQYGKRQGHHFERVRRATSMSAIEKSVAQELLSQIQNS